MGSSNVLLKLGRFTLKFALVTIVVGLLFSAGWAAFFAAAIFFAEDLERMRPPDPPMEVILQETTEGLREEIWVASRRWKGPEQMGFWVQRNCATRAEQSVDAPDAVDERIYYVYFSPVPLKPHEWNIETDEPNYVFRCAEGEVEVLLEHDQYMRDEQNRLIGPPVGQTNQTQTGEAGGPD